MIKKGFYVVFLLSFLAFFNTCYQEVPHLLTLHYALEEDLYEPSGSKKLSGKISFKVYPHQTLSDVFEDKEPSEWNWSGIENDKIWKKTAYNEYGFSTKNGNSTLDEPYIFSCPWQDTLLFSVDNIQNRQTIGLHDEVYDVKDLYVIYSGPSKTIEVTYVFYQNEFDGSESWENLTAQNEVRITKTYLRGQPIPDTPYTIEDANLEKKWKSSNLTTQYSRMHHKSSQISDFGYLTYDSTAEESENGLYCCFVDDICKSGESFTKPSGKYTFIATDDEENGDLKGLEYITNDAMHPLPWMYDKLILRPKYTEPTAKVKYFFYDKSKSEENPEIKSRLIECRVGSRLMSPEDLEAKYSTKPFWNHINREGTKLNYGYTDYTDWIEKDGTQIRPAYNFRTVKDKVYLFSEADDNGNAIEGKEGSILTGQVILDDYKIVPYYTKSDVIVFVFNYGKNENLDSYSNNTITFSVDSNAEFYFDYILGVRQFEPWALNKPYSSYNLNYGYRKYDASDSGTPGTMYFFTPQTRDGNDYQFLYYDINPDTGTYYPDKKRIKFGDTIDLQKFADLGVDYIIFDPDYTTKDAIIEVKHNKTVKVEDEYQTSVVVTSQIRTTLGEKFKYKDELIKDWSYEIGDELSNWTIDSSLENYGYAEAPHISDGVKTSGYWYDFDKTQEEDESNATYKFIIKSGGPVDSIWDMDNTFVLNDYSLVPKYTIAIAEITLVYYETTGNAYTQDYSKRKITRIAEIPLGPLEINPSKFYDKDYVWYNKDYGDWKIDSDDFAHTYSKNTNNDDYVNDYRTELMYGYRDPDNHNARYYFGDDINYGKKEEDGNIYKAYRYRCIDTGPNYNKEFVCYTDTRDTTPISTNLFGIRKITLTPDYINAGYGAYPLFFKNLNSSEKSVMNKRNSIALNHTTGEMKNSLSSNEQEEQDTILDKFATTFVFVPGCKADNSIWPSSVQDVSADDVLEYIKNTTYPHSSVLIDADKSFKSLSDLEKFTNLSQMPYGTSIPNLEFAESWLSRHFVLELLIEYYNDILGLKGTSQELRDSDFVDAGSEAFSKIKTINFALARYLRKISNFNTLTTQYPNIPYTEDEFKQRIFVFNARLLSCYDNPNYTKPAQGLQYYWEKDLPICTVRLHDAMALCNLMTYVYNKQNENNINFINLTYAYLCKNRSDSISPIGAPYSGWNAWSTTVTDDSSDPSDVIKPSYFTINSSATGFRIPTHQEYEYMCKIITNEMMLGTEGATEDSKVVPNNCYNLWTYKKDQSGVTGIVNHYFKTGLSASCQGLKFIPEAPLDGRIAPRNRTNKNEYRVELITPTSTGGATDVFLHNNKMRKDLNLRNGANIFDLDGCFTTLFAENVSANSDPMYLYRGNWCGMDADEFNFVTANFDSKTSQGSSWDYSFRVCRSI